MSPEEIEVHAQGAIDKGSASFAAAARMFDRQTRLSVVLLYAWCRHCDDVIDGQSLGSRTLQTDGEGLATRPSTLIDAGTASGFLYDTYTARALGAHSTGSAVRYGFKTTPSPGPQAVRLLPGTKSAEEIWAEIGDGLVIQEVSGMHSGVNPVSGDFSTGAEGVRLRGGEPAESVREVTIASTLQRMLSEVVAVGGDLEQFPMDAAGVSLAIADVTLSGSGS